MNSKVCAMDTKDSALEPMNCAMDSKDCTANSKDCTIDSKICISSPARIRKVEFTDIVGNFGRWQLIICVHLWFLLVANVSQNLNVGFLAPNIDYHCSIPEHMKKYNLSSAEWISKGIPRDGDVLSKCTRYQDWDIYHPNRTIVSCEKWDYDTTAYSNTITGSFDLVCGRKWMTSLLKSIFMFGYMVAGIVAGLSDRFGRRPVILFSIILFFMASLVTVFSTSFIMILVLRFLLALGIATCTTVTVVLAAEVVGPKERVLVFYMRSMAWTIGMFILVGIAYYVRDWTYLQITLTVPIPFLAFAVWWFVPESPRLLLARGDAEGTLKWLNTAAHWNRIAIKNKEMVIQDLMSGIERDDQQKSRASWIDLFRTRELRKRTLILYCVWFVVIFVYYGISYNTNNLHGDMYINFTISAAVEIPGLIAFFLISTYLGRRKAMGISLALSSITLMSSYMVPLEYPWIVTALMMTGKAFIRGAVVDIYIFTAELFPTVIRNCGLGSCSTFSRLGGIAAPFVMEGLGNRNSALMFGMMAAAAGMAVFLLPETRNKNILDTITEAIKIGRQEKSIKQGQQCTNV